MQKANQKQDMMLSNNELASKFCSMRPGCDNRSSSAQDNNRCACEDSAMECPGKTDSEMYQNNADDQCRCLGGSPRYLASKGQPNGGWDKADENEELLHVLVTRPEIVGKPRDNIVFEGDMDLRTTFETSYEALARMRLECWRRHQEMISGGGAHDSSCKATSCRLKAAGGQQRALEEDTLEEQHQQQLVSTGYAKQLADEVRNVDNNGDGDSEPDQSRSPTTRAPASDRDGACERQSSKRADAAVQVDLVAEPVLASPLPTTTTTIIQQQQSTSSPLNDSAAGCCCRAKNHIDPDLTPIIVYDANMNRLEKVGLRKRSKYRPSTSLRSGARGLFGDQEDPKQENGLSNSEHRQCGRASCLAQSINRAQVAAATAAAAAAGGATVEDSNTSLSQHNGTMYQRDEDTTGRAWDSQPTVRTELALHARNLKDSTQKDYLMYSDSNLPVDSKRKLKDNVNMIDHIKDQREANIVGNNNRLDRASAIATAITANELQQDQTSHDDYAGSNQTNMLEGESESMRLAKQEEYDAMEELRKITEKPIESSNQTIDDGISESDKHSRASRLRRTCQNQNFDIYNNDYRVEAGSVVPKMDERGTRLSPQSKFYTNLFRESPDFILTTGKFLDQEFQQRDRG